MRSTTFLLILAGGAVSRVGQLPAQTLARRIDGIRDGTIRLSFATRPEVCGNGRFIGIDTPRGFRMYTFHGNGPLNSGYSVELLEDVQPECDTGPMRLVIEKAGGRIADLRAAVGVEWRRAAAVTDLGTVSAADAAGWLLDYTATVVDRLQAVAFVAAVAADSARVADRLLAIARDRAGEPMTRSQALRWLPDVTAREGKPAAADETIRAIVRDESDVPSVRDRAVRDLDVTPANDAFLRDVYGRVNRTELKDRIIRRVAQSDTRDNGAWIRTLVLDERETPQLRDRAIRMLAERGAPSADLAALYDTVGSNALRQRVVRLLAQRGDDPAIEKLTGIAEKDPDPAMRRFTLRLLGQTRHPKARAFLERRI